MYCLLRLVKYYLTVVHLEKRKGKKINRDFTVNILVYVYLILFIHVHICGVYFFLPFMLQKHAG